MEGSCKRCKGSGLDATAPNVTCRRCKGTGSEPVADVERKSCSIYKDGPFKCETEEQLANAIKESNARNKLLEYMTKVATDLKAQLTAMGENASKYASQLTDCELARQDAEKRCARAAERIAELVVANGHLDEEIEHLKEQLEMKSE